MIADWIPERYEHSKDWPLVDFQPVLFLCTTYVVIVKYIGPRLMQNREPWELRTPMQLYNLLQVLCNSNIYFAGLYLRCKTSSSLRCDPLDHSMESIPFARLTLLFSLLKYLEFFDTIFFVLRKKFDQISTLHVVHHALVPPMVCVLMMYAPAGHSTIYFGLWNTFVHMVMYTYYFLASLGNTVAKYLWWKKYLTQMQLLQFVCVFAHALQVFMYDCDYPKLVVVMIISFCTIMLVMFAQFYIHSYPRGRNKANDKTN